MPRRFLSALYGVVLLLAACGSAVDSGGFSAVDGDRQTAATDESIVLQQYDAWVDPSSGFTMAPRQSLALMQRRLGFEASSAPYLADVSPTVTLGAGWNSDVFDTSSNRICLYGSSSPELYNPSGTQTIHGLRAYFSQFSNSNVTMSSGAVSDGSGWRVNFQELNPGALVARPFCLTNTNSASYRFVVSFIADSLNTTPASAQIETFPEIWTFPVSGSIFLSGGGYGLRTSGSTSGSGYVAVNGTDIGSVNIDNTQISFSVSAALPSEGFMTVNTENYGTITGPYIKQPQQLTANLKLPSGLGTVTSSVFWRECNGAICAYGEDSNCLTGFHDSEVVHNVTLNDSTFTPVLMTFLSQHPAASTIQIGFDLNHNHVFDTGDKAYGLITPGALATGAITDLGSLTFNVEIVGTCS